MRLKRLELQGFKSFAEKTVLDFPSGVVGIVGPNGSGKSNVIDAVRWLLGEREAKNLRGMTSEDLIFAGTGGRSRVGAAQATIHFDNSTGFFPVEFSEVAVTRKIYRDGTSQYLLNKAEVRLKDIIDFFAGSRLGTHGLTIINQGNSDLFVRATPAERREMVEEILGLRQYQLKRHEAELKLKNTGINLEKSQVTIDELLPRLRLLKRQAQKWAEHANIEKELRDLENNYYVLKVRELDAAYDALRPKIAALESSIKEKSDELKKLHSDPALVKSVEYKPKQELSGVKRRQEIMSRRAELERELGRLEAKMDFALSQSKTDLKETELRSALNDTRETLRKIINDEGEHDFKSILSELLKKIDSLFDGNKIDAGAIKKDYEKSREALDAELDKLNDELERMEKESAEAAKSLETFNVTFRKAFEAVENKKDELNLLVSEQNKLSFEGERVNMRLQELASQAGQSGRTLDEFRALNFLGHSRERPALDQIGGGNPELVGTGFQVEPGMTIDFDFVVAEKRMFKLRGDLAAIGMIDEAMLKEAGEAEERYTFLSTQIEDLTKASADLQTLVVDLGHKIKVEFAGALKGLNEHFNNYFRLMFNGGHAKLVAMKKEVPKAETEEVIEGEAVKVAKVDIEDEPKDDDDIAGLDIEVNVPKKGIRGLDMLSGGEKSLVSIAALFGLISISPPPFLVLDEVDAALDENNTRRFANLIKDFGKKTQFVIVTHNRATMEAADILYGVTMGADGASRVLSVKLE